MCIYIYIYIYLFIYRERERETWARPAGFIWEFVYKFTNHKVDMGTTCRLRMGIWL